ncbi:MAG: T9SS type A sorting domain-containing protein, partial [Bacteroidetes bacterium]|nr:T9SS type A sorting domain-containing protein [Bacteroidota bacterium]
NAPIEVIQTYPNPADDMITCDIISNINSKININIVDALGQQIIDKTSNITVGKNHFLIDVSKLAPAPYYFSIKTLDGLCKYGKQIIIR